MIMAPGSRGASGAEFSYDDIVKNCEVTYVAGGAAQNAARAAAVSILSLLCDACTSLR